MRDIFSSTCPPTPNQRSPGLWRSLQKGRRVSDAPDHRAEAPIEDAEFIQRVRDGDTGAYGVLYESHAAAARGLARQLMRGEAEAEDAVAEAFTRVLSVIQRGRGPRTPSAPTCSPPSATPPTAGGAGTGARSPPTTWRASPPANPSSTRPWRGWSAP
nr:sigma factor [Nocardiopsis sp. TSRI0078]